MKMFRWIAGLSLLTALLPLLGLLIALIAAPQLGCVVDEGSPRPCETAIGDVGGLLYTLHVGGWLTLLTLPFAGGLGIAWAIVEIARAARGKG